jgi:hypothetical protein
MCGTPLYKLHDERKRQKSGQKRGVEMRGGLTEKAQGDGVGNGKRHS